MRAFITVAEELQFGAAARRLGVSQPTVSQAIRRLEARLGYVVFERTSRQVALTEAGARLLPSARDIVARLERVVRAVPATPAAGAGGGRTALTIGMLGFGFAELTGPILAIFGHRHPEVDVALRGLPPNPRAFLESSLDVAITYEPFADERLVVHEMATEPRGVLVPARHPMAAADTVPLADALAEPFVMATPRSSVGDYWLAMDERGGELPRLGGYARNTTEVVNGILHLGLVTLASRSFARMLPLPGWALVGVGDLSPCTMTVAVRATDERRIVQDFVQVVGEVVRELADLAPGLTPLGDPHLG
ncbi:MAG: LysR family transcriptional regulator [Thermoleophilia bacterium]